MLKLIIIISLGNVPENLVMKKSKRTSSWAEWKEKMHESDSSVEWVWESDDESDLPSLRAISMKSLDMAEGLESEPLRVRFSADIDCQPYLHILNFTTEESDACFYTEEERASMSSSREKIIAKIDSGMIGEHEQELIRGLEYWCVSSSGEIDRRVDLMIERVMDEQDDQIDANILDNDALAIAAQDITTESAQVAQQNAARDALMAREAYLQMSSVLPNSLLTLDKRQPRRRKSRRKSICDMDTAALADAADEDQRKHRKVKKEKRSSVDKKDKKVKKGKRKKRSSSLLYKNKKGVNMDKPKSGSSIASEKSSKKSKPSNKKKALKKQDSSKKIKAQMRGSDRTLVTESETSIDGTEVKHLTESSLSSEEGERFLQTTKKQYKNQPGKLKHRHTVNGPPSRRLIEDFSDDDSKDGDGRPNLTRSFSWWQL